MKIQKQLSLGVLEKIYSEKLALENIGGRNFQVSRRASSINIYNKKNFLINTTKQDNMNIFIGLIG